MSNRITVSIGTENYTLISNEEAVYVHQIAQKVNDALNQVNAQATLSMVDAATLAAVNLADEAQKAQNATEALREQVQNYAKEMARLKEDLAMYKRALSKKEEAEAQDAEA